MAIDFKKLVNNILEPGDKFELRFKKPVVVKVNLGTQRPDPDGTPITIFSPGCVYRGSGVSMDDGIILKHDMLGIPFQDKCEMNKSANITRKAFIQQIKAAGGEPCDILDCTNSFVIREIADNEKVSFADLLASGAQAFEALPAAIVPPYRHDRDGPPARPEEPVYAPQEGPPEVEGPEEETGPRALLDPDEEFAVVPAEEEDWDRDAAYDPDSLLSEYPRHPKLELWSAKNKLVYGPDPLDKKGTETFELDGAVQMLFGYSGWSEYKQINRKDLSKPRRSETDGPTIHPFHVAFALREFNYNLSKEDYVVVFIPKNNRLKGVGSIMGEYHPSSTWVHELDTGEGLEEHFLPSDLNNIIMLREGFWHTVRHASQKPREARSGLAGNSKSSNDAWEKWFDSNIPEMLQRILLGKEPQSYTGGRVFIKHDNEGRPEKYATHKLEGERRAQLKTLPPVGTTDGAPLYNTPGGGLTPGAAPDTARQEKLHTNEFLEGLYVYLPSGWRDGEFLTEDEKLLATRIGANINSGLFGEINLDEEGNPAESQTLGQIDAEQRKDIKKWIKAAPVGIEPYSGEAEAVDAEVVPGGGTVSGKIEPVLDVDQAKEWVKTNKESRPHPKYENVNIIWNEEEQILQYDPAPGYKWEDAKDPDSLAVVPKSPEPETTGTDEPVPAAPVAPGQGERDVWKKLKQQYGIPKDEWEAFKSKVEELMIPWSADVGEVEAAEAAAKQIIENEFEGKDEEDGEFDKLLVSAIEGDWKKQAASLRVMNPSAPFEQVKPGPGITILDPRKSFAREHVKNFVEGLSDLKMVVEIGPNENREVIWEMTNDWIIGDMSLPYGGYPKGCVKKRTKTGVVNKCNPGGTAEKRKPAKYPEGFWRSVRFNHTTHAKGLDVDISLPLKSGGFNKWDQNLQEEAIDSIDPLKLFALLYHAINNKDAVMDHFHLSDEIESYMQRAVMARLRDDANTGATTKINGKEITSNDLKNVMRKRTSVGGHHDHVHLKLRKKSNE